MKSARLYLVLTLLTAASGQAGAAIAWQDGESRTITYTPGASLGPISLFTNTLFNPFTQAISVTSGTLPAGISVNGADCVMILCAQIQGVVSVAEPDRVVTLRASQLLETADIQITFKASFSVGGSITGTGIVGGAYLSTPSIAGGASPYTVSIVSGSLPPSLSINSSTGEISGVPSTSGLYVFQVQAIDSTPATATSSPFTIMIYDALTITTESLPATTESKPYSQTLIASGGVAPITWSVVSGTLPPGLSLDSSTGLISGTTTEAGVANFTVEAACCGSAAVQKALSITVNPLPAITTTSLPDGFVGTSYSQTLAGSGGTAPYSFSATGAPAGLTLDTSGSLTGTPTTAGPSSMFVMLTDSAGAEAVAMVSITIVSLPDITTTSLSGMTTGQSVSVVLQATGGSLPYGWSVASGSLPTGLTLAPSTGALTGTASTAGSGSFSVTVTDFNGKDDTEALSWVINGPPEITTSSLPATTVGAVVSEAVAASGGTGALSWTIDSGALPSGLLLIGPSGAIVGVPSTPGEATFTVKVTDENAVASTKALSMTINAAPQVTTSSLPAGVNDVPYSQTLAATGGTGSLTWTVSGALPAGLTLDSATGVISGTPTAVGIAPFIVKVTDSKGIEGMAPLSIEIFNKPTIKTSSLTPITVGQNVSRTIAASNGKSPYVLSISSGALPAGLSLDASTGAVTGVPTTAGVATFTVKVVDANLSEGFGELTWTVHSTPEITTSSLAASTVGATVSEALAATGGVDPLTWSVSAGSLPAGLTLDATLGVISGIPTAAETATFTIKATDSNEVEATRALTITVNPAPAITTTSLPFGVTGVAYAHALATTGGTGALTFSLISGVLPAGLTLDPQSGVISGTPSELGSYPVEVKVIDERGISGSASLTLQVFDKPVITTTALDDLTVGQNVAEALLASGGKAPYAWSIASGSLPAGLSLDLSTGAITGTTATAGTATFTARTTDANDSEDTQDLTWTVNAAPEITTPSLPSTTVGRPLQSVTLSASGGTGSLGWQASGLPDGVSLHKNGSLSGTPTAAGVFTVLLKVLDSNGITSEVELTLTVNEAPQITTTSLSRGVTAVPYLAALAATGGTGAKTWTLLCGDLPAGLSLTQEGLITGSPSIVETASFVVEVLDAAGATATATLAIEVLDPLLITTSTLEPATAGAPASATLAAEGGLAPYAWAVIAGALPVGITLDSATGALSGTPTESGTSAFTLEATDSIENKAQRDLSWLVNAGLEIETSSLPAATAGAQYSHALVAAGGTGTMTWTATGLPAGVTLDPATGKISGEFPEAGEILLEITVSDANQAHASRTFALLAYPALRITTTSIPAWRAGRFRTFAVQAEGGNAPLKWSGDAPAGLYVRGGGVLAGALDEAGTFTIRLRVRDSNGAEDERLFEVLAESAPEFELQPRSLQFQAPEGGDAPAPQQVTILSVPAHRPFDVSANVDWLDISFHQSSTPAVLNVRANPGSLEAGEYSGRITLAESGDFLDVTLLVTSAEEPRLTVDPPQITVDVRLGGALEERLAVALATGGSDPVLATGDPDAPWLAVETTPAASDEGYAARVQLDVDPAGLSEGIYNAVVVVSAGELSEELPVQLSVNAVDFRLSHSGLTFEAGAGTGVSSLQQIRVFNRTAEPLDWQASAEDPWS